MIGVISDTHDNVVNVKKATEKFKEANVEFVIHCGDVVSPLTLKFFDNLKLKVSKGNCDGEIEGLKKVLQEMGGEWLGEIGELEVKGKNIGVYHGTDQNKLQGMINSKKYDYILTGHTHKQRDETIGKTRIINPGAHYYGSENSIVLLDVEKNVVKFVELR